MLSANFGFTLGVIICADNHSKAPFMLRVGRGQRGEPFLKGLRQGRPTGAQNSEPRHATRAVKSVQKKG